MGKSRQVQKLDKDSDTVLETFSSLTAAAKAVDVDPTGLCRAISKGNVSAKFRWRYVDGDGGDEKQQPDPDTASVTVESAEARNQESVKRRRTSKGSDASHEKEAEVAKGSDASNQKDADVAQVDSSKFELAGNRSSSKFAGVTVLKGKWQASHKGKYIGLFPTELAAAEARLKHTQEHQDDTSSISKPSTVKTSATKVTVVEVPKAQDKALNFLDSFKMGSAPGQSAPSPPSQPSAAHEAPVATASDAATPKNQSALVSRTSPPKQSLKQQRLKPQEAPVASDAATAKNQSAPASRTSPRVDGDFGKSLSFLDSLGFQGPAHVVVTSAFGPC